MSRRRRKVWPLATVIGVLLLGAAALVFWNGRVARAGTLARVTVPAGATLSVAADSLAAADVVRSAMIFRLVAQVTGGDGPIVPGRYLVPRGATAADILSQLQTGRNRFRRVVIPEGWGITQIGRLLRDSLGADSAEFVAATRDSARRARMQTPAADVEGYLFPATYDFTEDVTAAMVVDTMLTTFERRWKDAWDAQIAQQGRTRHAVVTLASIVEKEAGRSADRPLIAAVYMNRLKAGMRLQADPTVLYAMKLVAKRVLYADLKVESPYNTYRVSGLPPGPIASPGTASLSAAIEPAPSDAMFFVAFPDGHSEFTRTFREHTVAVQRSRAARDSAESAKPTGNGR
ncbi:MAG: endolytic transglycosylase MltG [Gemmatimonadota bacterium]